jgi:hypothetical protein
MYSMGWWVEEERETGRHLKVTVTILMLNLHISDKRT